MMLDQFLAQQGQRQLLLVVAAQPFSEQRPLDLRAELHTAVDKASSAYRRHLKMLGITFGVC